ncbi:hypothetical protein SporoP37_06670 [Sporosarcina sp. P37]|uniref:DUF3231 family protein n=1 Tax=unclassified Sporosarcina TaxID=2647733 RepID=UPI0009BEE10E|nr:MULTISPECIES: DUF3231 family protein [unclassified Sporosarcina]ARD47852.1 hypothetical protein SporoP33_06190 [Sporosarcina sp. P33]ARK24380.1 hypothetical protein SporoP37_06670 [Sporosarcina sp. P37]PID17460.1 DUF3231 domain-containing protein [Sporosarcina sp. P35]
MGILDGNPKDQPLHYGEITAIWSFMGANNGLISGYEAFVNHAEDPELIRLLQEAIKMMKAENKDFGKVLKSNGITPPPSLPERPEANAEDIPAGARFMDPEISGAISINVGQGLVSCSMAMGQCLREDVAAMFAKCHMEKTAFGAKLLSLNKSKGWIIPPPLHLN